MADPRTAPLRRLASFVLALAVSLATTAHANIEAGLRAIAAATSPLRSSSSRRPLPPTRVTPGRTCSWRAPASTPPVPCPRATTPSARRSSSAPPTPRSAPRAWRPTIQTLTSRSPVPSGAWRSTAVCCSRSTSPHACRTRSTVRSSSTLITPRPGTRAASSTTTSPGSPAGARGWSSPRSRAPSRSSLVRSPTAWLSPGCSLIGAIQLLHARSSKWR